MLKKDSVIVVAKYANFFLTDPKPWMGPLERKEHTRSRSKLFIYFKIKNGFLYTLNPAAWIGGREWLVGLIY